MSLTNEGLLQRKWGPYPSLGKALSDKRIPDHHFGLTTIHDNKFDAIVRLMEIAILVDEFESDIKKIAKSVGREKILGDMMRLEEDLKSASYFFKKSIYRIREVSAALELT